MSTDIQPKPSPSAPEFKTFDRVTSIPLVQDSISAVHSTLQNYTPTAYAYATAISSTAYNLSTPLQTRLAPLIVGADGIALKGLDVAEKTFPTPFTIKTEEVVEGVKKRKDDAVSAVIRPVYGLANGVDSSLTPIVDRLEEAIQKYGAGSPVSHQSDNSTSTTETAVDKSQVGRLYNLGLGLGGHVYALSTDQMKQLQSQNIYIQNATEKVVNLNHSLSTSFGTAKDMSKDLVGNAHIQAQVYSQSIVAEVEKIQAITRALPKQLQAKLQPVQSGIQETVAELTAIVTSKDIPVNEKAIKVKDAVQDKVQPLLAQTTQTIQAYIADAKAYLTGKVEKAEEEAKEVEEEVKVRYEPKPQHDHNEDVPSFVLPPHPDPADGAPSGATYAQVVASPTS